MQWYTQADSQSTLLVACANLLKKLDYELSPQQFHQLLDARGVTEPDRNVITAVYPHIQISATGANSWPGYDLAIVAFQNDVNGVISYNNCAVLDSLKQTVIDSSDGQEKELATLGIPVAWTAYEVREIMPITAADIEENTTPVEPKTQFKPIAYKPGDKYIWCKGDNIWDVARMMGCNPKKLMEYNEMKTPDELEPGLALHVPVHKSDMPLPEIRYEILQDPLHMHVSKPGGTKKWAFGNVKTWEDFTSNGFFPEHSNITIAAIAHVPVKAKDGTQETAAYYMDAVALGDYRESNKVHFTIGFNWSDLAEGSYKPQVAPPPPPVAEKRISVQEAEIRAAAELEDTPSPIHPNAYKATYQALDKPEPCVAILPEGVEVLIVKEYDTRRPDRRLSRNQEVTISGTFEKDDVIYGRPTMAANNGYWYGIPMDCLITQQELYNTEVDLPTRVAINGSLTWQERIIWVPAAKTLTQYSKFIRLWNTKNKQKEK